MISTPKIPTCSRSGPGHYWGAYLGTPDEILISGKVAQAEEIERVRKAARLESGWIMNTYLLQTQSKRCSNSLPRLGPGGRRRSLPTPACTPTCRCPTWNRPKVKRNQPLVIFCAGFSA